MAHVLNRKTKVRVKRVKPWHGLGQKLRDVRPVCGNFAQWSPKLTADMLTGFLVGSLGITPDRIQAAIDGQLSLLTYAVHRLSGATRKTERDKYADMRDKSISKIATLRLMLARHRAVDNALHHMTP